MNRICESLILAGFLAFGFSAKASVSTLTYEGYFEVDEGSGGLVPAHSHHNFLLQVFGKDGGSECLLYSETQGYDFSAGDGAFQFQIGASGTTSDASENFATIFQNRAGVKCSAGATFNAISPTAYRLLRITETGSAQVIGDVQISKAPSAGDAETLNGKAASSFLQVAGITGCAAGTILSYDGSSASCIPPAASGGTITSVMPTAGLGLSGGGNSGNVTLGLANTTVAPGGAFGDATHVAAFTVNPQGQLTAANSVPIDTSPTGNAGGDLLGSTYPNPTIASIKGTLVGASPTTVGQVLRYDGVSWTPNFISMADLRSQVTGTHALSSCLNSETLVFDSVSDSLTCASIQIDPAQVTGLGSAAILNVGTVAGTVAAGDDSRFSSAVQKAGDAMSGNLSLQTTTPSTVGVPGQASPSLFLKGTYWTGATSMMDKWSIQDSVSSGLSLLMFNHTGAASAGYAFMNGNVGIGVTPTAAAALQLPAGTSQIAPLILTTGVFLNTPQSGAIEYDGSNLYFTDSSNTRKALAVAGGGNSNGNITLTSNLDNSGFDGGFAFNSGVSSLMTISNAGDVYISSATSSSAPGNGALKVSGGVGVTGAINAGGNISTNGIFSAGSGSAANPSYTFAGNSGTGAWLPSTNTYGVSTAGFERFRISSSGNVGIGTTNPNGILEVNPIPTTTAVDGAPILLTAQSAGLGNKSGGNIVLTPGAPIGSGLWGFAQIRQYLGPAILDLNIDGAVATEQSVLNLGTKSGGAALGASGTYGWQMRAYSDNYSPVSLQDNLQIGYVLNGTPKGPSLSFLPNGNVGVGTSSPTAILETKAAVSGSTGSTMVSKITINDTTTGTAGYTGLQVIASGTGTGSGTKKLLDLQNSGSVFSVNAYGGIASSNSMTTSILAGGIYAPSDTVQQPMGGAQNFILNPSSANGTYSMINFGVNGGASNAYIGVVANGAITPTMVFGQQTGTGYAESMRISSAGYVGIGTVSPRAMLDVQGAILGATAAFTSALIDFGSANSGYTSQSCGAMSLYNLKEGGSYALVIKGTSASVCSFAIYSDSGVTQYPAGSVHMPPNHAATIASHQTMYNFMVIGTEVYVSWTPGL